MVYAYVPNIVSIDYSVALCSRKTPTFAVFFGLHHLVVSPIGSSLRKLITDAQLQTFPYPMASKSFLYSKRGVVIEDLKHVLASPLILLGSDA